MKVGMLTAAGLQSLHEKMFGDVWDWAGKIRTEELNIGVKKHQIHEEIAILLGDVKFWLEHETYNLDEICLRFHHGLTRIHPFKNGNGRFARLAANLLLQFNGGTKFTWGNTDLTSRSPDREAYISALKVADETFEYAKLLAFARS